MVIKWEYIEPKFMDDKIQTELFQCLSNVTESKFKLTPYTLDRGVCRCTPKGMMQFPNLVEFCLNGLCSRNNIIQKYNEYQYLTFFCSNFGEDNYGCYFVPSKSYYGVLYVDKLTYSETEKSRRMLCATKNCNKQPSINAYFGCPDLDDEIFGPVDESNITYQTIGQRVITGKTVTVLVAGIYCYSK